MASPRTTDISLSMDESSADRIYNYLSSIPDLETQVQESERALEFFTRARHMLQTRPIPVSDRHPELVEAWKKHQSQVVECRRELADLESRMSPLQQPSKPVEEVENASKEGVEGEHEEGSKSKNEESIEDKSESIEGKGSSDAASTPSEPLTLTSNTDSQVELETKLQQTRDKLKREEALLENEYKEIQQAQASLAAEHGKKLKDIKYIITTMEAGIAGVKREMRSARSASASARSTPVQPSRLPLPPLVLRNGIVPSPFPALSRAPQPLFQLYQQMGQETTFQTPANIQITARLVSETTNSEGRRVRLFQITEETTN